jgi:hypothetical protein
MPNIEQNVVPNNSQSDICLSVTLAIILRDSLGDILRGLLPRLLSLTRGCPKNSESELGARVRFQTSFETQRRNLPAKKTRKTIPKVTL